MSLDPLRAICLREGVFLRHEALRLGYDDGVLRRSLRAGVLTKVRHGAYTFTDVWHQSSAAERHALLLRAVMRAHPDKVAASHHSAALLHGMDLWRVPLERAHVTRLDGSSGRSHTDSVHHQGVTLDADLTTVDSLRVVQPARAALESASLLGVESGLVLVDSGLRLGLFSPAELDNQLGRMTAWPDSLHLQLVTRLADGPTHLVDAGPGRGHGVIRRLVDADGVMSRATSYCPDRTGASPTQFRRGSTGLSG